jgi:hypothetical protein
MQSTHFNILAFIIPATYNELTANYTMNIKTRLDSDIYAAAKRAAELEGTSLAAYVRELVRRDLEAKEKVGLDTDEENQTEMGEDSSSSKLR